MASIPWFPLFAADLLMDDDLFKLDPKAEGLLFRMWCLCWVDGYAPSDSEALSLKVRRPLSYVRKYLPGVVRFFKVDEQGNLWSERLEVEREKAAGKSQKCRDAINARWEKRKKVGNSDEHTPVHTDVSTEPIPSQSPSQSPNTPLPPKGARRRRSSAEIIAGFSPGAERVVLTLRPKWRKEDPDGRPITIDMAAWGQRIEEILAVHPEITPELLIAAAEIYLAADRIRYQAPQWFFGVGKEGKEAAWVGCVKLAMVRQQAQHPPEEVAHAS